MRVKDWEKMTYANVPKGETICHSLDVSMSQLLNENNVKLYPVSQFMGRGHLSWFCSYSLVSPATRNHKKDIYKNANTVR